MYRPYYQESDARNSSPSASIPRLTFASSASSASTSSPIGFSGPPSPASTADQYESAEGWDEMDAVERFWINTPRAYADEQYRPATRLPSLFNPSALLDPSIPAPILKPAIRSISELLSPSQLSQTFYNQLPLPLQLLPYTPIRRALSQEQPPRRAASGNERRAGGSEDSLGGVCDDGSRIEE
ncbi:hypothetical protein BDY24DRAFT_416511 [Mrakia frigida]|uniref:uncharacterized protein n=1 Tax=Mrakia frigida TaxID=29902 RepID=UPI003FCC2386